MKVFSIGYQGLSLENYTALLGQSNVGLVLDVRETPWSYNRRYIRSVMQKALDEVEIEYVHLKECGNPSANRKTAKTQKECLSRYKKYLESKPDALSRLIDFISSAHDNGKPACLTCYEHRAEDCHRSILLDFVKMRTPKLEIIHIHSTL